MRELLFLTPVRPDLNGSGREKRAHQWITVLGETYTVTVVIATRGPVTTFTKLSIYEYSLHVHLSRFWKIIELFNYLFSLFSGKLKGLSSLYWIPLNATHKNNLNRHFYDRKFAKIICFRLYLSEYATYLQDLTGTTSIELDLDDVESSTWAKISVFLWKNRNFKKSVLHRLTSFQFSINERKSIQLYDRIYVCSELDRHNLSTRFNADRFYIFTNKLYGKNIILPGKKHNLNLLFVGVLSYYPNEEAIRWFIEHVFDELKLVIPGIKINIVGRHAPLSLRLLLNGHADILYYENLESIQVAYANSIIAISPLHAGGGTKLKIIEAMWFGLPVVATTESVRGMNLEQGVHYLKANEPAEFIACLHSLVQDPDLYNNLVSAASDLANDSYSY